MTASLGECQTISGNFRKSNYIPKDVDVDDLSMTRTCFILSLPRILLIDGKNDSYSEWNAVKKLVRTIYMQHNMWIHAVTANREIVCCLFCLLSPLSRHCYLWWARQGWVWHHFRWNSTWLLLPSPVCSMANNKRAGSSEDNKTRKNPGSIN